MAFVHIKSEDQRRYEQGVLKDFRSPYHATSADREAAEVVARRTQEAVAELQRMEERYK